MDKSNRRPRCVVISGIDGSGKTTVINAVIKRLDNDGFRTKYIWLRFNHYLTKIMHAIARPFGLSVKTNNELGDVWQHRFYKSRLFCIMYILTSYIDTMISRLKYECMAKDTDYVICDRWITDIIVDLATKTHRQDFLYSNWTKRFLRILPNQHALFVIYRNTDDIMDCRLENRVDPDFLFRLEIYKQLLDQEYICPINNSGTIENSVEQIVDRLYENSEFRIS